MRARYYDPHIQRFTQDDPSNAVGDYGYAGGNPASRRDPSGLIWQYEVADLASLRPERTAVPWSGIDPLSVLEFGESFAAGFFDAASVLTWAANDPAFRASYGRYLNNYCSDQSVSRCGNASMGALSVQQYGLSYYSRLYAAEGEYSIGGETWALSRGTLLQHLEQSFVIDVAGLHAGRRRGGDVVLAEVYPHRNGHLVFVWDQIQTRSTRILANVLVHEVLHLSGYGNTRETHIQNCVVAFQATRIRMGTSICSPY